MHNDNGLQNTGDSAPVISKNFSLPQSNSIHNMHSNNQVSNTVQITQDQAVKLFLLIASPWEEPVQVAIIRMMQLINSRPRIQHGPGRIQDQSLWLSENIVIL